MDAIDIFTSLFINCLTVISDNADKDKKLKDEIDKFIVLSNTYKESVKYVNLDDSDIYKIKSVMESDQIINDISEAIMNSSAKDEVGDIIKKSLTNKADINCNEVSVIVDKLTDIFYSNIVSNDKLYPLLIFKSIEAENNKTRATINNATYNVNKTITDIANNINIEHKTASIDVYDKSRATHHFNLFKHDSINIENIYIEPNYKIKRFEDYKIFDIDIIGNFEKECLQILDRQQLLILSGRYGCGKTVLSKYIQLKLSKAGHKCFFFSCSDMAMYQGKSELMDLFLPVINADKRYYLIFDAFDDINYLANSKIEVAENFFKSVLAFMNLSNVYVIINSRFIFDQEHDFYEHFGLLLTQETDLNLIDIIVIDQFSNDKIRNWLDSYSNEMAKNKIEKRLYEEDLKKLNKNLKNSCHNPLFLYMLVSNYYSNDVSDIGDIYQLYNNFVENTIKGKFIYENIIGAVSIKEISKHYREFIRSIAVDIAKKHDFTIETDQLYEWSLDSSTKQYGISHGEIANTIINIAKKLLDKQQLEKLDENRIITNVLSCYFIEHYNDIWKFRDNNVLFYLLSETLFECFKNMIESYDRGQDTTVLFAQLSKNRYISLHPVVLDILFNKIYSLSEGDKAKITYIIRKFIDDKSILQIRHDFMDVISSEKLDLNLLLCITYLQLNKEGYYNLAYYFKRLNWYISAAKVVNRKYLHLARRFFKDVKLYHTEFRRINFDEYNFDLSETDDVKFLQSKFHNTRMNNIKYRSTSYILCDFDNVDMNAITGCVKFKNCIVNNVKMDDTHDLIVEFDRCSIKSLQFHSRSKSSKSNTVIKVINSDVDNLIIRKSNVDLTLKHCFYSIIKAEGSIIRLIEHKSYTLDGKTSNIKTDTQTDIIYLMPI